MNIFVKYRDYKVQQRRITKCDRLKDYKVRQCSITNYHTFPITKCDKKFSKLGNKVQWDCKM